MVDPTLVTLGREIDMKLVDPLRRVLIGRELIPIPNTPRGLGVTSVEWNKLTEMSGGMVSYAFTEGNEDMMTATPTVVKRPIHWKDFKIDRGTYESYKLNGIEFDASVAISAGFVAAKVEDQTILDGIKNDDTNYDVQGLYPGAGQDYSTSKDFGTFGNPTIAVGGALDKFDQADIPTNISFNLILASTQRNELRTSRSTNGVKEEPDVLAMLNGGKIFSTNVFTAGTGLLLPAREALAPYVDYWIVSDFKTELGVDSAHPDTGPIIGRVYSAGRLRIKENKALCKLSAI